MCPIKAQLGQRRILTQSLTQCCRTISQSAHRTEGTDPWRRLLEPLKCGGAPTPLSVLSHTTMWTSITRVRLLLIISTLGVEWADLGGAQTRPRWIRTEAPELTELES